MGLTYNLLQGELYATDAAHPAFTVTASDVIKVGMDNPDATLLHAPISGDGVFRVYGTVYSIRMLEFVVSGGGRPMTYYLDEFDVGDDGSFSLVLAAERHPGNWIELPTGARSLLVRRVQYDWDVEEIPHLAIERVDTPPTSVPRCLRVPTAAEVGEQLDALATLVEENADYWVDMVHSFRSEGDNVIPAPRPLPATGMNTSRSSVKGFFVLEPDEALVVSFTPPGGNFWSISIGDMWYRTFDYSYHQTSLNGHQAWVDGDGQCRFVIAGRDPGAAHWLDTVGHPRGVVCIRWVMTDGRPQPEEHVARLDELDRVLPAHAVRVHTGGTRGRDRAEDTRGRTALGSAAHDALVVLDRHHRPRPGRLMALRVAPSAPRAVCIVVCPAANRTLERLGATGPAVEQECSA